jgi:hypothetical protein
MNILGVLGFQSSDIRRALARDLKCQIFAVVSFPVLAGYMSTKY